MERKERLEFTNASPAEQNIIAHHITPERAGELFAQVKPQLAVFSHIVLPVATDEELIPPARMTYSGPLEVGEVLMAVRIGEKVEVRRHGR